MSEVRWCDRHDGPFSVATDGWETYQGTKMVRNPGGHGERVTINKDVCGPCANKSELPGTVAIESVATQATT